MSFVKDDLKEFYRLGFLKGAKWATHGEGSLDDQGIHDLFDGDYQQRRDEEKKAAQRAKPDKNKPMDLPYWEGREKP